MNIETKWPQRFFGLHMAEGVVEYPEHKKRYLVTEAVLREMDPTLANKECFVNHVDDEAFAELSDDEKKLNVDGYCIRSFYNELDGKHWVEFLVTDRRGIIALQNGYRLSNMWQPTTLAPGGLWHAVPYDAEITGGEYLNMAIVKRPRYQESKILTPDEFRVYNENLKEQLAALKNSMDDPKEGTVKLLLSNVSEIKDIDVKKTLVPLEKCKKQISLETLINEYDDLKQKEGNSETMADLNHKVKLDDATMCNVGELVEKYHDMMNALEEKTAEHEELKKKMDEMHPSGEEIEMEEGHDDIQSVQNDEEEEEGEDKDKKAELKKAKNEEERLAKDKKKNAYPLLVVREKITKLTNELNAKKTEAERIAAAAKAAALRAAGPENLPEPLMNEVGMETLETRLARGSKKYGSAA